MTDDDTSLEKRYLDSARRFAMAPIAANGAALALVLPKIVQSPQSIIGIEVYLLIALFFTIGLVLAGISYWLELVHLHIQVNKPLPGKAKQLEKKTQLREICRYASSGEKFRFLKVWMKENFQYLKCWTTNRYRKSEDCLKALFTRMISTDTELANGISRLGLWANTSFVCGLLLTLCWVWRLV